MKKINNLLYKSVYMTKQIKLRPLIKLSQSIACWQYGVKVRWKPDSIKTHHLNTLKESIVVLHLW